MLHKKVHRTVLRIMPLSPAPTYLPVKASPAYAKPSVKYENSNSSFIIIEPVARRRSP